jgi:hypothetical protein
MDRINCWHEFSIITIETHFCCQPQSSDLVAGVTFNTWIYRLAVDLLFLENQTTLEEFCLLGYNAAWSDERKPTFQRNIPPPPSGSKGMPIKKPHHEARRKLGFHFRLCLLPASCWFTDWLILSFWRWRQCVPPKCRLTFNVLHGVISLNTVTYLGVCLTYRRVLDSWPDLLHTYTTCYYTSQTTIWHTTCISSLFHHLRLPPQETPSILILSKSKLLYDWRFTANLVVLA